MRRRFTFLVALVGIALVGAACGRASEVEINQALGITPTATASATAEARALALSSPGAGALGDVTQGAMQFQTWCAGCHRPGGLGPDIRAPGSVGASVTADSLLPLIRDAEGHSSPPGPYQTTEISNAQIADIAAYLNDQAAD